MDGSAGISREYIQHRAIPAADKSEKLGLALILCTLPKGGKFRAALAVPHQSNQLRPDDALMRHHSRQRKGRRKGKEEEKKEGQEKGGVTVLQKSLTNTPNHADRPSPARFPFIVTPFTVTNKRSMCFSLILPSLFSFWLTSIAPM